MQDLVCDVVGERVEVGVQLRVGVGVGFGEDVWVRLLEGVFVGVAEHEQVAE